MGNTYIFKRCATFIRAKLSETFESRLAKREATNCHSAVKFQAISIARIRAGQSRDETSPLIVQTRYEREETRKQGTGFGLPPVEYSPGCNSHSIEHELPKARPINAARASGVPETLIKNLYHVVRATSTSPGYSKSKHAR